MNFYYSILGLVSVLMLKYQQLFYISAVPSQKTISFFMELHELAILGKSATQFKLNYLFQVLLSMQITKATSTKLKREKSIFVFLTAENAGFMNPGFFFLGISDRTRWVPCSSRHHNFSHKTQLFPSQIYKFSSILTRFMF